MKYPAEDKVLAVFSAVGALVIGLGYEQIGGLLLGIGGILKALWPAPAPEPPNLDRPPN